MLPKISNFVVFALSFALVGCSTDRVSTEFKALNDVLTSAESQVSTSLKPGLESARQAELTASAQAGDAWFLSEGCRVLLKDDIAVATSSCKVVNLPLGGRQPVQNEATSAKRKMDTLSAYVAALELLMDASSDSEITESYAAALASFSELGKAAEIKELTEFVSKRQSESDTVGKVVSSAIATLRYNRMKSVVKSSNDDVNTVARELQLHLLNLGVDKGTSKDPRTLSMRIADLNKKNETVLLFNTSDAVGYRNAIVELQMEQKSFMDYYEKTAVYKVGLVAEVHNSLDQALRNPGSVEEVIGYLENLKSLIDTVEG